MAHAVRIWRKPKPGAFVYMLHIGMQLTIVIDVHHVHNDVVKKKLHGVSRWSSKGPSGCRQSEVRTGCGDRSSERIA